MSTFSVDYEAFRLLVQEVKEYSILILNTRGEILTWNAGAQRLKGYSAEEAIGKSFSIFYDPADVAGNQPRRDLEKAFTEGRVEDEGWRVRKDGTRFWANVVITTLHDRKSKVRGFAKITRDMTEHRRAEDALLKEAAVLEERVRERTVELEKANRMKDEFISTLSHELRTPLTAIAGWVDMLQTGNLSEMQREKGLEVIHRNLVAQARLIDDLLDVAGIVNGTVQIDMQPVYPAALIEEAIDSFLPTVTAKKLKLTQDLDSSLGPLAIDAARFHQIVWNLLTNAVKFTPRGRIHVTLKKDGEHALLRVSDPGEGIDAEFLPLVFDRFRQADGSTSRRHGGLGVGLTIVKNLVELHGGTIQAQSAGVGKGSTFNVSLPIPTLSLNAASLPKRLADRNLTLKGMRILVVDDEEDTREMIAQALTLRGARAVKADSAAKALDLLKRRHWDLVISDIGMPGVDGYGFIRTLRAIESPISRVPAAALTAYVAKEDRNRSIEAGFNAHLTKPISVDALIRVIYDLMGEPRKLSA